MRAADSPPGAASRLRGVPGSFDGFVPTSRARGTRSRKSRHSRSRTRSSSRCSSRCRRRRSRPPVLAPGSARWPRARSTTSANPVPCEATVSSTGGSHSRARGAQLERRAHGERAALGAFAIRLVDHEQVADLHEPGLHRLDAVARLGHQHHRRRVGGLRHLELALPDAHGLDQDAREAGRVEHVADLRGVDREPAEAAARRHRADEHARIARQLAHAHAIAEQRAAAERARRVDRHDRRPSRRGCRYSCARRVTSVLLPAPGGPVIPIRNARPAPLETGVEHARSAAGASFSTHEIARASATRSPATIRRTTSWVSSDRRKQPRGGEPARGGAVRAPRGGIEEYDETSVKRRFDTGSSGGIDHRTRCT